MAIGSIIIAMLLLTANGVVGRTTDGSERATLLQLSVESPAAGAAELRRAVDEETTRMNSCSEALELGKRLKARGLHGSLRINIKTNAPVAALPAPIREALLARPAGRATPVYGGETAFRVLMRCEATFNVPGQAPPRPNRRGAAEPI